jgi:cytochrome c553
MIKGLLPTIFGAAAAFAVAAVPAHAADEIEASLQVCSTCHGQNGQPIDATIPIIWGQQTSYLVKQIHDYKSGDRENAIMKAFADNIKQPDIRKAATYLAEKTWPAHPAGAAASPPNGMAVCRICHQENFQGGLPAPRLAGQRYEYLIESMRRYADGERTNSPEMLAIMKALSPADRETMARYISGL